MGMTAPWDVMSAKRNTYYPSTESLDDKVEAPLGLDPPHVVARLQDQDTFYWRHGPVLRKLLGSVPSCVLVIDLEGLPT